MMDYQEIADLDRMIACVSREIEFRERVWGKPAHGICPNATTQFAGTQAARDIETMRDVLAFLQKARAGSTTRPQPWDIVGMP